MSSLLTTLSISGLLVFGTTTSLFAKIVYELKGPGKDGKEEYFTKPWAMTTVMFLGMTLCLPLAYWEDLKKAAARRSTRQQAEKDSTEPLLSNGNGYHEEPSGRQQAREIFMLAIPTAFDLMATVLMNIGLLSVTASVYQMMRGAEMLFAALFAVVFLKRQLNKYHFGGILCCVVGIMLVGLSSVLSGEGSSTHAISTQKMLLGMALIVMSQAVQAAQITFEDHFMADLDVAPLKIVGYEGLFGSIVMMAVMLPAVYFIKGHEGDGLHEDTLDTLHMITHSKPIAIVLLFDMLALLAYNFSGMCVTGALGAVFRTVLETMRTLFVWLVDLLLFYTPLGFGTLGESWSRWSFVQAGGFLVLVAGTFVYRHGEGVQAAKELAALEGGAAEEGRVELPPGVHPAAQSMAAPLRQVPSQPVSMAATPQSFRAGALGSSYGGLMSRSVQRHGSYAGGATPRGSEPMHFH